jgi:hypothetical protein
MEQEIREGLRLLKGLEEGNLSAADAFNIAEKRDPVLVFFVLRFLRDKYPAANPSSEGVVRRVLELTSTYPAIVAMSKKGEADVITEWFNDSYAMAEFYEDQAGLMAMIVEKIEG